MDKSRHIDNKIREGFESQNKTAPDNLWDKISDGLSVDASSQMDDSLRNAFEAQNQKAPEQVWSNINKQLNIDNVWIRTSRALKEYSYWRWTQILAVLVAVTATVYILQNQLQPEFNKTETAQLINEQNYSLIEKPDQDEVTDSEIEIIIEDRTPKNTLTTDKTNTGITETENTSETPLIDQDQAIQVDKEVSQQVDNPENKEDENLASVDSDSTIVPNSEDPEQNVSDTTATSDVNENKEDSKVDDEKKVPTGPSTGEKNKVKKYEIGLITSFNNTWILNNETRAGYSAQSLTRTKSTREYSYGISFNYKLKTQNYLASELWINSPSHQHYYYYRKGHLISEDLVLDYLKLALMYEYRIGNNNNISPASVNLKIGGYGAYLKNQTSVVDEKSEEPLNDYRKIDYGLKVAIGRQKSLYGLQFEYGLHSEIGLMNIYKGNNLMPSAFDYTRNINAGLYLGIRF